MTEKKAASGTEKPAGDAGVLRPFPAMPKRCPARPDAAKSTEKTADKAASDAGAASKLPPVAPTAAAGTEKPSLAAAPLTPADRLAEAWQLRDTLLDVGEQPPPDRLRPAVLATVRRLAARRGATLPGWRRQRSRRNRRHAQDAAAATVQATEGAANQRAGPARSGKHCSPISRPMSLARLTTWRRWPWHN